MPIEKGLIAFSTTYLFLSRSNSFFLYFICFSFTCLLALFYLYYFFFNFFLHDFFLKSGWNNARLIGRGQTLIYIPQKICRQENLPNGQKGQRHLSFFRAENKINLWRFFFLTFQFCEALFNFLYIFWNQNILRNQNIH